MKKPLKSRAVELLGDSVKTSLFQPPETRPPALGKNTLALGVWGVGRDWDGKWLESAHDQGASVQKCI